MNRLEQLEKLLADSKDNWSSPELYNTAIALLEIARAATKLRAITPNEMQDGKPFWVIPCDSYEPLREALDKFEESEL